MTRDAEHTPSPQSVAPEAPAREGDDRETYEIGKRDGYEQAVQDIDMITGGDGEFYVSTAGDDCPDVATMKARISDRFAALTPRHEAPADPCASHRSMGFHIDPCCPHCEAPAEGAGEAILERLRDIHRRNPSEYAECCSIIDAIRARSSAPEAREGEAWGWAVTWIEQGFGQQSEVLIGAGREKFARERAENESGHPGNSNVMAFPIYTHPAAPNADKLRIAAEALGKARADIQEWATMCMTLNGTSRGHSTALKNDLAVIDQALADLKAEGAK